MVAAVAVVAMVDLFGFRNKVCRRDKVGNELYICFSDHRVCDCEEKGVVYLASYLHGCNWMVGLLLRHIYLFVDLMEKYFLCFTFSLF